MIELRNDSLVFSFPDLHASATLRIDFQRTLRIPDDDRTYPLPPGLGRFPLRHVDDYSPAVPDRWMEHGGVMLPMYQSEALWLNFHSPRGYPFAVKVAAGKINAVTGDAWTNELHENPQDYLVVPKQPWLDGFCVRKGVIRQFVAMPLSGGYTAEEQLTGRAEHGGVQIIVYPARPEVYRESVTRFVGGMSLGTVGAFTSLDAPLEDGDGDMGLAPGGEMRQTIERDTYGFRDWRRDTRGRCFVHLANSLLWRAITGANPPTTPPTATEYTRHGLPWFEYYGADSAALEGAARFQGLKSVAQLGKEKGEAPLPENASVDPQHVVSIRKGLTRDQVREGVF